MRFHDFFFGGGAGWQSVTVNELFLTIKVDVASSALSPQFNCYFLLETSQSASRCMCENFNERNLAKQMAIFDLTAGRSWPFY